MADTPEKQSGKERSNTVVRETIDALKKLKDIAGMNGDSNDAEKEVALEYNIEEVKRNLKAAEHATDEADAEALKELNEEMETLTPMLGDKDAEKELKTNASNLSVKIREKIKPTPAAPDEKSKSILEKFSDNLQKFQNMAAHYLAPMIESLQAMDIPFLGSMKTNIDAFMSLVGMNRLMLFSALHKNNIDPVFNTEKPSEDRRAMSSLNRWVQELNSISPKYVAKTFFDALATAFAKELKNRKTFTLTELADFAANNGAFIREQRTYAEDLRKATTPAPVPAPAPTPAPGAGAPPPATT